MTKPQDIDATYYDPANDEPEGVLVQGATLCNGKYELLKQIGKGAMGVVWRAQDHVGDRLVALKFVPKEFARFEDEIERMRKSFKKIHDLNHRLICPTYGLEQDSEHGHFLVMKHLEGETLVDYALRKDPKQNGLPMEQALDILTQVAEALDFAHDNDVIHRDIKPSNIFLAEIAKGVRVQVIDFGIADEIRSSASRVSQVKFDTSGSPAYMAPEQWKGQRQTAETDQYSLGVVAYELLAGNLPFSGGNIENAVLKYDPEPIDGLSDTANAALSKVLAKTKAERFATCMDFVTALGGGEIVNRARSVSKANESRERNEVEFTPAEQEEIAEFCAEYGSDAKEVDEKGQTLLYRAIERGKINVVKFLVSKGAEVNVEDKERHTPLHWSAGYATAAMYEADIVKDCHVDIGIIKFLISEGADVNIKDNKGVTLLHLATGKAERIVHTAFVRFRTSQMADNAIKDDDYRKSLHDLAERTAKEMLNGFNGGDIETIKFLVSKGADVNAKDTDGRTPLHLAASHGHVEVVKYLVSQGAGVKVKTEFGVTPLHYVANLEIAEFLVSKGADVNAVNKSGYTPLHDVANLEIAEFLVSKGADVNAKCDSESKLFRGTTPLHCQVRDIEVVKFLVANGADVNAKTEEGETPLHSAAGLGIIVEVVEFLLSKGADVHAKDRFDRTPLHAAAISGSIDVIKFLISHGADVNAVAKYNGTPLHMAAQYNENVLVAQFLVSQGADVLAKNNDGKSPLDKATEKKNTAVIEYLSREVELRRRQEAQRHREEEQRRIDQSNRWAEQGLCRHCGGEMGGWFTKKCKSCGKSN